MPGPEAPNPNQDPMQTQAISMDAVRQAREAIQPSEAPDAMQSQAMSLAGLRKVREGLSQISDVAPATEQTPTSQQNSASVEAAAVRVELPKRGPVATETERQMGIADADRKNRQTAGLPPRTFDLR